MTRKSTIQTAQENILKDLLEGASGQFFRGVSVVVADPCDVASEVAKALAEVGLCVVVEVSGGPAPIPCDPTEWDAAITVVEHPAVNRTERSNGKTADVVLDAVLLRFAQGGHFRAERVVPSHEESTAIWIVEGKTSIVLAEAENGGGEC